MARVVSRGAAGPRKVLVGTSVFGMWDPYPGVPGRLKQLGRLVDLMADQAAAKFPGRQLDIAALPAFAVNGGRRGDMADVALPLEGPVLKAMSARARRNRCYLVVPMYLVEDRQRNLYYNAAALLDRRGELMGMYRYRHPVAMAVVRGVTPGREVPIFDCDFGRVGLQISDDVLHNDGWRTLRRQGVELVLLPAVSPVPLLAAMRARSTDCYLLTSTWRVNAALFAPTGQTLATVHRGQGYIMVEEIDLSYTVLGWNPTLRNGLAFSDRYGSRVGFRYWDEEDRGLFWSNDPQTPILKMVRQFGYAPLDQTQRRDLRLQRQALRRQPRKK